MSADESGDPISFKSDRRGLLDRATTAYVATTGREPEPDGLAAALALVTCVDCDEPLSERPGGLRECINPECDMSIIRKPAR